MYLMIRNPGVAPSEGFTVLGVSTTRFDTSSTQTIGQFGSGSKHAINLLLRNDILPVIFCGNLKLEFFTRPQNVDDGITAHDYSRVCVKFGGKDEKGVNRSATEDLGFVLEHGTYDWTDLSMGLREFVSNALDRTVRETGDFKAVEIEVVDKPRAKAGTTAVFIPLTQDVSRFHRELPKRFLHFSEPASLKEKILSKKDRNLSEDKKVACIYKKGVFIREVDEGTDSVFDYNLGDDLQLDESRNVNDYTVKHAVARAMADAPADKLALVLKAMVEGRTVWEHSLDSYYLKPSVYAPLPEARLKARKDAFQEAWKATAGEDAVATSKVPSVAEYVRKKGFTPMVVESEGWMSALKEYGIPTDAQVLTDMEKKGSTVAEATPDMILAVDKVWNLLSTFNMLNGREKPPVKAFTEVMDAESSRLGYYDRAEAAVYLHSDLGVGQSPMLLQTALEEVVHHVTGAGDMSRDLQDFLFRLVVAMGL